MANQAPAHWSRDFVEHLRTVHFTLIALCVGLVALSSFPNKSEIQIAHDQVSEIRQVVSGWQRNFLETEAENYARSHFSSSPNTQSNPDFRLTVQNKPLQFPVQLGEPGWLLRMNSQLRHYEDESSVVDNYDVKPPISVASFRLVWDWLFAGGYMIRRDTSIGGECHAVVKTRTLEEGHLQDCRIRQASASLPNQTAVEMTLVEDKHAYFRLGLGGEEDDDAWDYALEGHSGSITDQLTNTSTAEDIWFIIPVRPERNSRFDPQLGLTRSVESWRAKDGQSFRQAFAQLASVDEPFENADLLTAQEMLDFEASRTGDVFEAAGLKIPADVAVRCGVLLVLGVQFYMLIHLREFGNRLDRQAGFEVAWIGVYTSKLSRVLLIISLLVLPACTVILLSHRGLTTTHNRRLAWYALIAANAASLALSYLIFKALPQPPAPALAAAEQSPPNAAQSESDAPVGQSFE